MTPCSALWIKTPIVHSLRLSRLIGRKVYLKLESFQPTGSYKDRGISRYCEHLRDERGARRLVSSSGGNAGHAVANAGRVLGLGVTVVVPKTTSAKMADKIRSQGAAVEVHGRDWAEADALARSIVDEDASAAYVTPFDDPIIWEGHSNMVDEIHNSSIAKPGAIVTCVGGGGLVAGLYRGLARVGWGDTAVLAAETAGAASFTAACRAGKLVTLDKIDTIATTLGARRVAQGALDAMQAHPGNTVPVGDIADAEAVRSCARFLNDHRVLVEPSCGAALSLLYEPRHRGLFDGMDSVVVVVCGGSGVDLDDLNNWMNMYCDE